MNNIFCKELIDLHGKCSKIYTVQYYIFLFKYLATRDFV
jgi:hypothetical protein